MVLTLKAARVNAGLTQKQMADKLGVSETTVWKWETGASEPRLSQFKMFCEACGVKMSDIFLAET